MVNQQLLKVNQSAALTGREWDCLELMLQGGSSKHIARDLSISFRTVEKHIENIKLKFGMQTRLQLISHINESMKF